MGTGEAEAISVALIAAGKSPSTPVAVVENASLPESRIIFSTLGALPRVAGQSLSGPAVIFLGPQFRARARAALLADKRAGATARSGR
jgi:uroporphyrin-III C-methyltransferase / precorrin-2 dehydrogenase / sirohydrochlorin ferrochelatase